MIEEEIILGDSRGLEKFSLRRWNLSREMEKKWGIKLSYDKNLEKSISGRGKSKWRGSEQKIHITFEELTERHVTGADDKWENNEDCKIYKGQILKDSGTHS